MPMFLQLAYKNIDLYTLSKKLVFSCYEITHGLPEEEKDNLVKQVRTSALEAYMHIVRGLFSKSDKKRKNHFKISRQALQIIDASIELMIELKYVKKDQLEELENSLLPCYRLLKKMKKY